MWCEENCHTIPNEMHTQSWQIETVGIVTNQMKLIKQNDLITPFVRTEKSLQFIGTACTLYFLPWNASIHQHTHISRFRKCANAENFNFKRKFEHRNSLESTNSVDAVYQWGGAWARSYKSIHEITLRRKKETKGQHKQHASGFRPNKYYAK